VKFKPNEMVRVNPADDMDCDANDSAGKLVTVVRTKESTTGSMFVVVKTDTNRIITFREQDLEHQ
jgi:hypothetical protein